MVGECLLCGLVKLQKNQSIATLRYGVWASQMRVMKGTLRKLELFNQESEASGNSPHFLLVFQLCFRHFNIEHFHRVVAFHFRGFFIKLGSFVHFFIAK